MEVTKWLKPPVSVSRIGDSASVQAVTRMNAEQASHEAMGVTEPDAPVSSIRFFTGEICSRRRSSDG